MKKIISSFGLIIIGIFILFFPNFIGVFNTALNYKEILKTFSWARFIFGPLCCLGGVIQLIFEIKKIKKLLLIRQVSPQIIKNDKSVDFPLYLRFFLKKEKIEFGTPEHLGEIHNHSDESKNSNLIRIKNSLLEYKYSKNNDLHNICYLGIDYIPYIVQLGVYVSNTVNIVYYHHFGTSKKSKVKRVKKKDKKLKITLFDKIISENIDDSDCVLFVEISAKMDIIKIPDNLSKYSKYIIYADKIGRNNITLENIDEVSNYVYSKICYLSKKFKTIHLLLCCPACMCFAIGKTLRINELSKIIVYDFNSLDSTYRPWFIELSNT